MGLENESNASVAENSGAGNDLHLLVKSAEILDNGLVIANDLVYNESIASMLGFRDHDVLTFGPLTLYCELLP